MNPIALQALERNTKAKEVSTEPGQSAQREIRKSTSRTKQASASRDADKFVARLPDDLRSRLAARSKSDDISMNSVLVSALKNHLDCRDEQKIIIDSLVLLRAELQKALASANKVS